MDNSTDSERVYSCSKQIRFACEQDFFLQNVDITSIFSICTDCVILCIQLFLIVLFCKDENIKFYKKYREIENEPANV